MAGPVRHNQMVYLVRHNVVRIPTENRMSQIPMGWLMKKEGFLKRNPLFKNGFL